MLDFNYFGSPVEADIAALIRALNQGDMAFADFDGSGESVSDVRLEVVATDDDTLTIALTPILGVKPRSLSELPAI